MNLIIVEKHFYGDINYQGELRKVIIAVQTSRAAKGLTSRKKPGLSYFNSSQKSDNGREIIITQTF